MEGEKKLSRKEHKDRPDLTGEHKFGDAGQLILFFLFIIVWIADSFLFHYTDILTTYIPAYIRLPLGIAVLIFSFYITRASLKIVFKDARDGPEVIRTGVFNKVRHPMYLGAILLYLGLLVFAPSIIACIIWIMILGFYHYIARYEEKLLLQRFGEEYKRYMDEVPRWLYGIKS
jgi:protein-S-isoprenylcysteine O-methyltransferase Ste14